MYNFSSYDEGFISRNHQREMQSINVKTRSSALDWEVRRINYDDESEHSN